MGAPYTEVTVTGYNDNPPVDDGTQSEENRDKWSTIKTKLPDPLKTALEAIDDNVLSAFGKIVGGAGVVSSAISATVGATDQGKLYRATGAGITITTPDATSVTSPFVFGFLNSSTGTVTLDGNGAQTVNGQASIIIPVNSGGIVYTDGTNWFIAGIAGVAAGNQLMYAEIINGTIAEANVGNAVTFSLKTLAGADPSTTDPVLIAFRNATAATGNYVYRTVTAALTLTLSSGSTLGAVSATAFNVVLALFDDGGTIRLGAINPFLKGTRYYDLTQTPPIASSTTEGGAGAADSAKVWYTGTGVTSKAYVIIAIANYASGLATAGTWNVSPTTLQLYGHGITLPGVAKLADTGLQLILSQSASASATIDFDDTNAASGFDGTYDHLVLMIASLIPATDDTELNMRVKAAGSYQADAADYAWDNIIGTPTVALAGSSDASDSEMTLTAVNATLGIGNASGENLNMEIKFSDPDTAKFHDFAWSGIYNRAADGLMARVTGGGQYIAGVEAITGVRFLMDSGNITSGTFSLYGLRTS